MHELVIKNGTLVTPLAVVSADVAVDGERIAAVESSMRGCREIDATGLLLFPGVIDAHVHMALPVAGTRSSDDFLSGTQAAACGGVTTIVDFTVGIPERPIPQAIEARLAADPAISHVAAVHHETTTGRLNDLAALGRLCKSRGVTLLLDAVSSFGGEELAGEDWNLGALAGTANKCLHGVAGLAFVLAPVPAWERVAGPAGDSVYLHLGSYYQGQHGDGFAPFTLPVQLALALDAALDELADGGGWQARRQVYRERAARIHATLLAGGVAPLLPDGASSAVLRAYRLPAGLTYEALHDRLKADGFIIYAGQGDLAREIFRISPMGDIRPADLDRLCGLLADSLRADPRPVVAP